MTRPALPPKSDIVETFHGVDVADPYRILEDPEAPETKAWVDAQNAYLNDFLEPHAADIEANKAGLESMMNYPRTTLPGHYGKIWLRTYNAGLDPQPTYQVSDKPDGEWRTLFDPKEFSTDGTVTVMEVLINEEGTLAVYTLSHGGDDKRTLKIRDIKTGEDLPDVIEDCRFISLVWDKDNKGFLYTYPANDDTGRAMLKHHTLGTSISDDKQIFIHPENETTVGIGRGDHSDAEFIYIGVGTDNRDGIFWRKNPSDEFTQLVPPLAEEISIIDYIDGEIYAVSKGNADKGELVKFDPATPDQRTVLVPASKDSTLNSGFYRAGKLFLSYSEDTADAVRIHELDGTLTGQMDLPVQSIVGFAHDSKGDAGCYVRISGFQSSGTAYFYNYADNALTYFAPADAPVTLEDCIVERVRVPSKDGTLVPMTIIRHPDTPLDGTASVKLYGYGGFNVPLTPGFSPLRIVSWVKAGGIFAQANLRGGGEFGQDWYDAGRLLNKQNTFDDFIACSEWLIDKQYTNDERLVIEGGSNGGLLTLAVMLQRPDLFGAVISHVPVTDMLRYDLFHYGRYWKSDYGDPKVDENDFKATLGYAPLLNIKPGVTYPPHLVLTASKDTRVAPMHAEKFVAQMQENASAATKSFLHVEVDAGHGAGTALQKTIDETALIMGFCAATTGPLRPAAKKPTSEAAPGVA